VRFILLGALDLNPGSLRREEVEAWVRDGTIEWPGHIDDVRPWITACSVYVLPSYYREGIPRSTQEAMAMGRPVITTDAIGCRETVRDGYNGFLVPARDVDALAAAMLKFVDNPDLIVSMGAASRQLAEERFDIDRISTTMLAAMGIISAVRPADAT
jgi:glycosyltransferase involved in cell wall biosynthesis